MKKKKIVEERERTVYVISDRVDTVFSLSIFGSVIFGVILMLSFDFPWVFYGSIAIYTLSWMFHGKFMTESEYKLLLKGNVK